jgi:hypothetical protein
LGIVMSQSYRFLEKYVAACGYRLPSKWEVGLGGGRDVQDLGLFGFQHGRNIGIPMRNSVAGSELLSHDGLKIANGHQLNGGYLSNLLNVCVGDLSAADNCYLQAHCFPLETQHGTALGYNETSVRSRFDRQQKHIRYSTVMVLS